MDSLRGQLLVAAPALVDPNFRRTVVLILEHTSEGALGLVLNRPTEVTAGEAVPELAPLVGDEGVLYLGGPVQPGAVIALGEYVEQPPPERSLIGPVAALDLDEDADELAARLARARLFAGYAGWGEGQLDDEVDGEDWITLPALPGDVFGAEHERLWNRVLHRKGGRFQLIATMPEDPSLN
jgi:putative transcriptional regulator